MAKWTLEPGRWIARGGKPAFALMLRGRDSGGDWNAFGPADCDDAAKRIVTLLNAAEPGGAIERALGYDNVASAARDDLAALVSRDKAE